MNHDDTDFEKKLRALAGALRRPDPTPAWKADILARARREADAIPTARLLPPRLLTFTWAAAWVAIALLSIATPRNPDRNPSSDPAVSLADRNHASATAIDTSLQTLVAFHRQYNVNNDLP